MKKLSRAEIRRRDEARKAEAKAIRLGQKKKPVGKKGRRG